MVLLDLCFIFFKKIWFPWILSSGSVLKLADLYLPGPDEIYVPYWVVFLVNFMAPFREQFFKFIPDLWDKYILLNCLEEGELSEVLKIFRVTHYDIKSLSIDRKELWMGLADKSSSSFLITHECYLSECLPRKVNFDTYHVRMIFFKS